MTNIREVQVSNQSRALDHSLLLKIMFVNFQLPARPRVYDVSGKASKESLERLKKPKHQVSPFSSQSNESILNATTSHFSGAVREE